MLQVAQVAVCSERRSVDRFIYRPSPYRAVNTLPLGYKNQSVDSVSGNMIKRWFFFEIHKTLFWNKTTSVNVKPGDITK
jgi:hypothetical protein